MKKGSLSEANERVKAKRNPHSGLSEAKTLLYAQFRTCSKSAKKIYLIYYIPMLTLGEDGFVLAEIGFIIAVMFALMLGSFLIFCLRNQVFQMNAKVNSQSHILEQATTILRDQNASIQQLKTRLNEWDEADAADAESEADSTADAAPMNQTIDQIYTVTEIVEAPHLFPVDVVMPSDEMDDAEESDADEAEANTDVAEEAEEADAGILCYEPTVDELIVDAEHYEMDKQEMREEGGYKEREEQEEQEEDPSECFERLCATPEQQEWVEMQPIYKPDDMVESDHENDADLEEQEMDIQGFESDSDEEIVEELVVNHADELVDELVDESIVYTDPVPTPENTEIVADDEANTIDGAPINVGALDEEILVVSESVVSDTSVELFISNTVSESKEQEQTQQEQTQQEQTQQEQTQQEQTQQEHGMVARVFDEDEISICSSTYKTEKPDNAYKHLPIAVLRNVANSKMPGEDFTKMKKKEIIQVLLKHDDQDIAI